MTYVLKEDFRYVHDGMTESMLATGWQACSGRL
jgi:hypothetical protein